MQLAFEAPQVHHNVSIMGGAISSLHRLRSQFLISLYKKGFFDQQTTIRSLFESLGTTVNGVRVIPKSDLNEILGEDSSSILKELFRTCRFQNECIPLNFIVDFLEQGLFNSSTIESVQNQINNEGVYQEVWEVLNFHTGNELSTDLVLFESSTTLDGNKVKSDIKRKETKLPNKKNVNCRSIWKKHETVIQERIVKHVTINDEGNINELITTDKSQNDVIHIESKISGEYAHREFTQQEQTEQMDNEMSTFIRATEEYIHLKSKDDEYEYLHSEVPPQDAECDDDVDEAECDDSVERDYEAEEENDEFLRECHDVEYS